MTSLHSQRHLHSDPRPHPLPAGVSAHGLPPLLQAHETEDPKDIVLTLKSTAPTMQTLSRGQTVEIHVCLADIVELGAIQFGCNGFKIRIQMGQVNHIFSPP